MPKLSAARAFPPKYIAARNKIMQAAFRGTAAFKETVYEMWASCEPPFQVCNRNGVDATRPSDSDNPHAMVGCLTQVKQAFARKGTMAFEYVAATPQLTQRICNDPLIPSSLDDLTPNNYLPFIDRMIQYQIEMDDTIRKGR